MSTVAILSLIAYLAMGGFRESAQDSKRLSDLTSLSTAIDTYIQSHGAAPEPSNPKQVTFSGANIWTQGIIDDSVTQRIGNVDPGKKDTDYGTYYTYSVLNSGKEFQLGTIIQTEEGATAGYFPLSTAWADSGNSKLTKALALTKGNYNGILARTRSITENKCDTIALPSIILSKLLDSGATELKLTNTGVLVIDKEGNIPASYQGTSVFTDGNELFRSFNDSLVELDVTRTCDLNSVFNGTTSENSLLSLSDNIQRAYDNTPIAKQEDTKYYEIASTPLTDTGTKLDFAKKVVVNVIGEEVRSSPKRADTGCSLQPNIPYGTGYYDTGATQPDQIWKYWNGTGAQPACSFQCVENYAWNGSKRLCQETRLFECGKTVGPDKPDRSSWTSGSGYIQKWNVTQNKWVPEDSVPEYNAIPTDGKCYFTCDEGYKLSLDGKKCVKDCSMQSKTINFHTYYTPDIPGGTTLSVASQPIDIMASCVGNNVVYAQDFNCSVEGELTSTGTESIKAINCGINYTQDGLTCKSDTRYTACGLYVPTNSTNNSLWVNATLQNMNFKQTWKCSNWDPVVKNFEQVPAGGQCTFVCNPGYTWSASDRMCKPTPCTTPWGVEIPSVPDGYSGALAPYRVRAFLTNSVPFGETCTPEFRLCTKGVLSGSYQYPSCTVEMATDCASRVSAINGHSYNISIMANAQVTSFNSQPVYVDEKCNNQNYVTYRQTFVCNNGVVGISGSGSEIETINCTTGYTASGSTCVPNTGSGSCAGTIPANASASTPTTYNQVFSCADNALIPTYTWTHAATTCGFECNSGYTWSDSQQKCLPNSCTLPWGGTISSGSGVTAYASSNILKWKENSRNYTMNCKGLPCDDYVGSCSTAGQTATCGDCDATVDPATGWYQGFIVKKSCAYDCASETRTCTNGVLSGTYTNPTCSTAKVCRGTLPATHASFCAGDTTGLTVDTDISQVVNCTAGTKCEYQCTGGYTGANCDVPPPSCICPSGQSQCSGDPTKCCSGVGGIEYCCVDGNNNKISSQCGSVTWIQNHHCTYGWLDYDTETIEGNCGGVPPPCDTATQTWVPEMLVCKGADGLEHGSCTTEGATCAYTTAYNNSPTLVDSAIVYLDTVSFKYIDTISKTFVEKAEAMCAYGNEDSFGECGVGQLEKCIPCTDGGLLCRCSACTNSCSYGYAEAGLCTCNPAPTVGTCIKKPGYCQNKINGVCGDRATSYLGSQANWGTNLSYCSTGTVSPVAPVYPATGASTTWVCGGLYGGNSVSCSATRGTRPPGKCSCIYHIESLENCPSGAWWDCSDGSTGGCYGESPSCMSGVCKGASCTAPNNVATCTGMDGSTKCFSGYPLGWSKPGDLGCKDPPGFVPVDECDTEPPCTGGPSPGGGYCYCCGAGPVCVGPGMPLPC